jgi:hypothetical protein
VESGMSSVGLTHTKLGSVASGDGSVAYPL